MNNKSPLTEGSIRGKIKGDKPNYRSLSDSETPPDQPPPRLIGNHKPIGPSNEDIKPVTSFSSVVCFLSGVVVGVSLSLVVIILHN